MRKLLVVVVCLAACGGKKDQDKPAAETPHDAAAAAKAKPTDGGAPAKPTDGGAAPVKSTDGGGAPGKRVPLVERAQVDALMTAWLEAQNSGAFDAYAALYTEDFKGVRRSGKQTVRLDRTGWLKDRKKMFARPMLVAARDVEITLGPGRATARFTQEWSSGKYHDVGPKVLEVVADGTKLAIAREELLTSRIVKTAKPAPVDDDLPPLFATWDQRVVITSLIEPGWASGEPKLLSGQIPERDESCDDDPPDYEEEQDRYWACESSDPDRGNGEFTASQPVDLAALPKSYTALIGQEVRITNPRGASCSSKIEHLELYAEATTTYSSLTTGGSDDDAIAAAVLGDSAVLVGKLSGGCDGDYAQLASATPAVPWVLATSSRLDKQVRKAMKDLGMDEWDVDDVDVQDLDAPDGKHSLVVVTRDAEPCFGHASMTMVFAVAGGKLGDLVLDESGLGAFLSGADVDGDGWPELAFYDGIASVSDGLYDRDIKISFTDEIETECGE